jgi:hypothetical protein
MKVSISEADLRLNINIEQAKKLFPIEHLQDLDRDSVSHCQTLLGHGSQFGVWETPQEIAGTYLKPARAKIVLRDELIKKLSDKFPVTLGLLSLLDHAEIWLARYALLLRLGPSSMKKQRLRSLDASTIISMLTGVLPSLLAASIESKLKCESGGEDLVFCMPQEDLFALCVKVKKVGAELKRLMMLKAHGLWRDAPLNLELAKKTNPKGNELIPPSEDIVNPYLPLSDEYMSTMGPRVLWMVKTLGPKLIYMAETIIALKDQSRDRFEFYKSVARYLSEIQWQTDDGSEVVTTKFINFYGFSSSGRASKSYSSISWPPRTWFDMRVLFISLQTSHLWIVLLAMAGRIHEILTLSIDCIEEAVDGKSYVNGKTYKLSGSVFGEDRQWPAPQILVETLLQQQKLIVAADKIFRGWGGNIRKAENTYLWSGFNNTGNSNAVMADPNHALQYLGVRLGVTQDILEEGVHAHRFRKTIARLVALAVVESPRVLMALLGHKDVAMTLHYILSDKALQVEIEQVARELRIIRCQEVVEDIHLWLDKQIDFDFGGYGGGAMPKIVSSVMEHQQQLELGGHKWNNQSAYEVATTLTLNGQYYRIIKPGVICTKPSNEMTSCKCGSDCINRIEEKTARRDVMQLIPLLIDQGRRALDDRQLLVVSNIVGQLEIELSRFEDINKLWQENSEINSLKKALEEF